MFLKLGLLLVSVRSYSLSCSVFSPASWSTHSLRNICFYCIHETGLFYLPPVCVYCFLLKYWSVYIQCVSLGENSIKFMGIFVIIVLVLLCLQVESRNSLQFQVFRVVTWCRHQRSLHYGTVICSHNRTEKARDAIYHTTCAISPPCASSWCY